MGGRLRSPGLEIEHQSQHPRGDRLLTGTIDGRVAEWDPTTGGLLRKLQRPFSTIAYTVAYSPDGALIAAGGFTTGVWVWDSATGKQVASLGGDLPSLDFFAKKPAPDTVHGATVYQIGFGKVDGKTWLASACWDGHVRLWKVPAPGSSWPTDPVWVGKGHEDYVSSVAIDPVAKTVVSGSFDKTVRVWRLDDGRPVGEPIRHRGWIWSLAHRPGTSRLLVGTWYQPEGTTWAETPAR